MTRKIKNYYEPDDISKYSFKQRLMMRAGSRLLFVIVSLIGKTLRYETEGWENFEKIYADGKIPIYVFWHNRIFAGTYFFRKRGIIVMSSKSRDSEYSARLVKHFGYGTVRGSSSRGGVSALVELIRAMREKNPVAFSIDGPRGPKYVAKSGACLLAKKTGNPMMPFVVEAQKYWEIGSWDKLQIPKPFSRVRVIIETPIYVEPDADGTLLENKRLELQKKLDELVARGEQWRLSKN
jgi:lysophospholipid acyltransferase (LPLAT)-like uncharacterized protein